MSCFISVNISSKLYFNGCTFYSSFLDSRGLASIKYVPFLLYNYIDHLNLMHSWLMLLLLSIKYIILYFCISSQTALMGYKTVTHYFQICYFYITQLDFHYTNNYQTHPEFHPSIPIERDLK